MGLKLSKSESFCISNFIENYRYHLIICRRHLIVPPASIDWNKCAIYSNYHSISYITFTNTPKKGVLAKVISLIVSWLWDKAMNSFSRKAVKNADRHPLNPRSDNIVEDTLYFETVKKSHLLNELEYYCLWACCKLGLLQNSPFQEESTKQILHYQLFASSSAE